MALFVRYFSQALLVLSAIFIGYVLTTESVLAQEVAHGNGALEIFDAEGQANSPTWVKIWIVIMLASFASGLLFVWKRIEARWVVGGFLLGLGLLAILTELMGLVPLSGLIALIHLIFWTPGLIILLRRRTFLSERSLYGVWTGLMTLVILFSFLFDIRDTVIYIYYITSTGPSS